jgi:YrbI family 3-deoxy-D-manno-octulosonate 8-phosphate phosphatase
MTKDIILSLAPLAGKVDLFAFDFDGVLTDNRVLVMENGLEAVLCNRSDGLAFDMMRYAGLAVLIVSTERNNVVSKRAEKLNLPVLQAITDKKRALEDYCTTAKIDLKRVAFVGNDVNDLSVMQIVGFPIAVADAHSLVKNVASVVLETRGGDGVAREIAEMLLGISYGASDQ